MEDDTSFAEHVIWDQLTLHGASIDETTATVKEYCPELTSEQIDRLITAHLKRNARGQ